MQTNGNADAQYLLPFDVCKSGNEKVEFHFKIMENKQSSGTSWYKSGEKQIEANAKKAQI